MKTFTTVRAVAITISLPSSSLALLRSSQPSALEPLRWLPLQAVSAVVLLRAKSVHITTGPTSGIPQDASLPPVAEQACRDGLYSASVNVSPVGNNKVRFKVFPRLA